MDLFDVIVADPPWSYTGQQDKWGAAAKFYTTMTDAALLNFSLISESLAPKGVLFLWATSPRLDFALRCIERWGLTFRGVAFVWVKTKKDGVTPIGAQGVRPSIVKPTTEFVLAASRVAKGRPRPLWDESVRQVVLAAKQDHSRKPEAVMERIESLYPDATRLEMFARHPREGWESWGDEVATAEPA